MKVEHKCTPARHPSTHPYPPLDGVPLAVGCCASVFRRLRLPAPEAGSGEAAMLPTDAVDAPTDRRRRSARVCTVVDSGRCCAGEVDDESGTGCARCARPVLLVLRRLGAYDAPLGPWGVLCARLACTCLAKCSDALQPGVLLPRCEPLARPCRGCGVRWYGWWEQNELLVGSDAAPHSIDRSINYSQGKASPHIILSRDASCCSNPCVDDGRGHPLLQSGCCGLVNNCSRPTPQHNCIISFRRVDRLGGEWGLKSTWVVWV